MDFKLWMLIDEAIDPLPLSEVTLGFGQHGSKPIGEVPESYLRWALDNASRSVNPVLRKEIIAELERRKLGKAAPAASAVSPQTPTAAPVSAPSSAVASTGAFKLPPNFSDVFTFGKFNGKRISEVPIYYVNWCANNLKNVSYAFRIALIAEAMKKKALTPPKAGDGAPPTPKELADAQSLLSGGGSSGQQAITRSWIASVVIADAPNFKLEKNEVIAVMRVKEGTAEHWSFVKRDKETGSLPDVNFVNLVKFIRVNGEPDKFTTPEEVFEKYKENPVGNMDDKEVLWTLAKVKDLYAVAEGDPLVLHQEEKEWIWMSRNGNKGEIDSPDISPVAEIIQSNGRPVQSNDYKQLFEEFDKMFPQAKKAFALDEYKQDVQKTFAETDKNIMINALAGTGKTTVLRALADKYKKPGEKWLYLVFNKKNQIEASTGAKAFKDITVLTSHAYMYDVLNRAAANRVVPQMDLVTKGPKKLKKIIEGVMDADHTFPWQLKWPAKQVIEKIVYSAKCNSINPTEPDVASKIASFIKEEEIDTNLSTDRTEVKEDYTPQLIQKSVEILNMCLPGQAPDVEIYRKGKSPERISAAQLNKMRDHDDSTWFASLYEDKLPWDRYDVVLVDEVQDFNKNQCIIVKKLQEKGARIVCVGDPNQALYLFAGANEGSFEYIKELVNKGGNGAEHPLPINYRSGTEIIDWCNNHTEVDKLQAGASHRGKVVEGEKYGACFEKLLKQWNRNNRKLNMQTAFMCLNNKQLCSVAMDCIKHDVDFDYIGKDLSTGLTNGIRSVVGRGERERIVPIAELATLLNSHYQLCEEKWSGKITKFEELNELKDITESLTSIIGHLAQMGYKDKRLNMEIKTSQDLLTYIERRFQGVDLSNEEENKKMKEKDPRSSLILTTIHKAKGMEYDAIYWLGQKLFARTKRDTKKSMKQKQHAFYVGGTRPIYALHVLADEEEKEKEEDQRGEF